MIQQFFVENLSTTYCCFWLFCADPEIENFDVFLSGTAAIIRFSSIERLQSNSIAVFNFATGFNTTTSGQLSNEEVVVTIFNLTANTLYRIDVEITATGLNNDTRMAFTSMTVRTLGNTAPFFLYLN